MHVKWADIITLSRLLLIVPTTAAAWHGSIAWFIALYALTSLTDFFDGYVARRTGTASEFGAKFDASVDSALGIAAFWWLTLFFPASTTFIAIVFSILLVVFAATGAVSLALFRKILSPHAQAGRIAAVIFHVSVPAIVLFGHLVPLLTVCVIAKIIGRIHTILIFAHKYREERALTSG